MFGFFQSLYFLYLCEQTWTTNISIIVLLQVFTFINKLFLVLHTYSPHSIFCKKSENLNSKRYLNGNKFNGLSTTCCKAKDKRRRTNKHKLYSTISIVCWSLWHFNFLKLPQVFNIIGRNNPKFIYGNIFDAK